MKIAIPVAGGKLCAHFGHCEQFKIFETDDVNKAILGSQNITPPQHEPGVLPRWLAEKGVNCIIAGGMGSRAAGIFQHYGVRVITGAPADEPSEIVLAFLHDKLATGANACDH